MSRGGGDVFVLYFYQGELGESLGTPNAFAMPPAREPTLGAFLEAFPLDASRLHFRFKTEDPAYGYGWMDVMNTADRLPMVDGIITAKVLRLDAPSSAKRSLLLKKHANYGFGNEAAANDAGAKKTQVLNKGGSSAGAAAAIPAKASQPVKSTAAPAAAAPAVAPKPASAPVPAPRPPTPPPQPQPQQEFDFFAADNGSPSPTTSSAPRAAPVSSSSSFAGANDIDDGPSSGAGIDEPNREELVAKRDAEIKDRVDSALQFKKDLDENQKKESDELEAAKAKHDASLTNWASNNKEKRNVRTLLTTMHTVLWPGANWKPIGLGDVIDPSKVKLSYRKAMLVVHPDRCATLTPETRFIAKRIFEAINEAYQEFLKKEGLS